ncbi:MAG: heme-binding protein [Nocardioides sp.]
MRLDLELAEQMTRAACDAARDAGCLVSAAVVDAGGHLVSFRRMDGAEFAGATIAVDKAFTAAGNRIATLDLRDQVAPGGDLAGYYAAAGGRFIAFGGGVPLWYDGLVTGAVGVSGASGEQDHAFASAGAALWLHAGGALDG